MYRPLPNCLTIKKSRIHGLGLFAIEDIPPNTDLGITHIPDERFEDGYIRTPLGGFFNHSKSPNCIVISKENCLRLMTDTEIKADTELTAFYTLYKISLEK
ncbi:MAG: SET domain-containing protein, partial [Acidobacteriota bacterium]|nr:SET domain-containing protein [Acidobacteriota bacterium]